MLLSKLLIQSDWREPITTLLICLKCFNQKGVKFVTRYRFSLSYLCKDKIIHPFNIRLILTLKSTTHFFLHCPLFTKERRTLISSISSIDRKLLDNTTSVLTQTLLFTDVSQNLTNDRKIPTTTNKYTLSTERFDGPMLWNFLFL